LAQSRHVSARDISSDTVHSRSFQERWSENIGDVRPTELNLKPSFMIAFSSRLMILRNGMDLHTIHKDMVTNVTRLVCGVLLTVQLL
jgi:hypothetical protein